MERTASRTFTLIELLVVVAVIAIIAAILLPSLSAAREKSKRTVCMSNIRQLWMGMEFYAEENDTHYTVHGGNGVHVHTMSTKVYWRDNYLGSEAEIMYCPSGDYQYNHAKPNSAAAKSDPRFGYANWIGFGGDTSGAYRGGWRKGKTKYTPTVSRREGEHFKNFEERPMFTDLAGLNGSRLTQNQASRLAFPSNNHQLNGYYRASAWMSMVFLDGHAVGVNGPHSGGYRVRIPHERGEVGHYYW